MRISLGSFMLAISLAGPLASADDFMIVASEDLQGTRISREMLATIFMSATARLGDGTRVIPVDQSLQARIRTSFSLDVLGQPVGTVMVHWRKLAMSGYRPPVVKASDEEVLAFVAQNHAAVGYVSVDTAIPPGIKVLTLTQ